MVCFRGFSYVFCYILFVDNILVRVAKQFLRQVAFIAEAHRFHAAVFADIKFRNRGVAADTNITQTFNIVLQKSHTPCSATKKTVRRDDRCFAHAIRFHACKRLFCAVINFRCRLSLRKNAVLRGILPFFGKYRIIRERICQASCRTARQHPLPSAPAVL